MTGTEIDEAARQATTAARKDGAAQPEPSKRRLSTGQRIGAILAAALCVAAIGVSAAFLFQPSVELAPADAPQAAPAEAPAESEAALQEEPAADGSEEAPDDAPADEPAAAVAEEPRQEAPAPETPAPSPAASPAPEQRSTVTVSVQVSSSAVGDPVSGGTTATFEPGATVYDALMACGLSVNASQTGLGVYVTGIGGLAEFDHGGSSGWVYTVNGADPGVAASACTLQDGDAVQWFYVV
ncbi:DUF4430 domain-containing protein [Arabiibacter massiliensis]|uniref:DUF4430 domain-containing protein n=1 Tax=Arabiibacter massiliensis TaxID=1870985 RepID=UPI0009BA83AB|nr:DUF4430 domain-containing protein [Arabiibacter massiliensis]